IGYQQPEIGNQRCFHTFGESQKHRRRRRRTWALSKVITMEWLILIIVSLIASTISGIAGFGGSLILLPVLTYFIGIKAAIPVLTVAQIFGNLSRAGFGWGE